MELSFLLAFVGGLLAGIVIALALALRTEPGRGGPPSIPHERRILTESRAVPDPVLESVACASSGSITFVVSSPVPPPGMHLVGYYSKIVPLLSGTPPSDPPSDANSHGTATTFTYPAPPQCGTLVVWAKYETHATQEFKYCCSSSCCDSNGPVNEAGFDRMMAPGTPDAFPASYRLVPESSAPGSTPGAPAGPSAQLVGLLPRSSETLLRYVAEASTPAEPLWRALGGPGPIFEAALVLRYRPGGIGAVLTVATVLGDRQVKLRWVTDDWQFYGANRFRCESTEPGVPTLVVSPA